MLEPHYLSDSLRTQSQIISQLNQSPLLFGKRLDHRELRSAITFGNEPLLRSRLIARQIQHLERDTWDVRHPAEVRYVDGSVGRPVHRIQPVTVVQDGPDGTSTGIGSLTFIDERPLGSA